jgi:hypothetical protein
MKKFMFCLLTAAVVLLSGCASTVTSDVSIFHQWPANLNNPAQKTYLIERSAAQENDLAYRSYEDVLRAKLDANGFTPAKTSEDAALKITMSTSSTLTTLLLTPEYRMAMVDPFWQLHFNRRRLGYYGYYPYYPYYSPQIINDRYSSRYLHQLEIAISDIKTGKKLADLKASTEQFDAVITDSVPYLIESALKNFPGKSGARYEVKLPEVK